MPRFGRRLLLPLVLLHVVKAYRTNRGKIPSGYNVPCRDVYDGDDVTQPVAGCYAADLQTPSFDAVCEGVGHMQCAGGGDRNVFGQDFQVDRQWTRWLCEQDSDGDGWTNGQELGDPCCTWTEGEDMPTWPSAALSHPGFASATPLEPLTYDCSTTPPVVYATGSSGGNSSGDDVDEAAVLARIFADGEEQLTFEWSANGVALPEIETIYMKERLNFPVEFGDSFYLVGIQVHVRSAYIHHLVVYQCPFVWADGVTSGLELEFDDMGCAETIFPWAPGPTVQSLPPDVGFWCGPDSPRCKSLVVDVHYDNPDEEAGLTDSSGITFYATPYREHAMGTLSTGSIADGNTLQIPPGRQDHFDATACVLHADDSVQVAGNFFHAHELGTGFWTDLYRDDVKIEEIGRDHAWSFDDQRFTPMSETLMLQAGDVISTVCTFDATQHPDDGVGRTETTYGGLGTRDEMCINFIWYWPQDHNAYCLPCSHVDGSLSEDGHTIDDSGALYPDGGLDALISSGQCAHVEACNPGEGDCMCTATELWSIMDILKDEGTENEWMTGITSGCYSCLYSSEFSSECFAPQCSTTHCMCNEEDLESMALTDSNNLMPHVSDACTSCLFYSDDVFWCLPDHDTYEVPVCNIEQLIATVAAATADSDAFRALATDPIYEKCAQVAHLVRDVELVIAPTCDGVVP